MECMDFSFMAHGPLASKFPIYKIQNLWLFRRKIILQTLENSWKNII